MFKDEFDLLEIRFRELDDHVDVFVIVESDHTHTCRPKPFNFQDRSDRFSAWQHKIRYVKHTSAKYSDPWANEVEQRCAIVQGIQDADSNDIIIVSDCDEIIRGTCLDQIRTLDSCMVYGFHMPLFNFKFNFMRVDPGPYDIWATAARACWIKEFSPQVLRNLRSRLTDLPFTFQWQSKPKTVPKTVALDTHNVRMIQHGGWHFGYLGDDDYLLDKAKDTCHQEDINARFLSQLDVQKSIQEKKCWDRQWPYRYEIVDLDSYFPKSCARFPQHILPNSNISALHLLSEIKNARPQT
jgi:beta-1,4-mannosyl-glycoprotein beta-1,4-N-acetylglucosaminyltransferase